MINLFFNRPSTTGDEFACIHRVITGEPEQQEHIVEAARGFHRA